MIWLILRSHAKHKKFYTPSVHLLYMSSTHFCLNIHVLLEIQRVVHSLCSSFVCAYYELLLIFSKYPAATTLYFVYPPPTGDLLILNAVPLAHLPPRQLKTGSWTLACEFRSVTPSSQTTTKPPLWHVAPFTTRTESHPPQCVYYKHTSPKHSLC